MLQAPRIVRWTLPALLLTLVVGCLLIVAFSGRDSAPARVSNGSSAPSAADGKRSARHMTARRGDTPTAIARRAKITLLELLELNPALDPRALRPGQRLKIRR